MEFQFSDNFEVFSLPISWYFYDVFKIYSYGNTQYQWKTWKPIFGFLIICEDSCDCNVLMWLFYTDTD